MCGIFGVVFNSNNGANWRDADAVADLLYMDALRGMDSTGVGLFTNEQGLRLVKGVMDANDFLNTSNWVSVRSQLVQSGKAFIGHNRKKTIGAIKDESAHPFLYDDRYLFIHNGTLYSHKHLADTEVDSEALGKHLTKCKNKIELEEALVQVNGAYACAWIDRVEQKLYLLRNRERPLWYGKFDGGWGFCSEPGFIKLAFIRQGIKMEEMQEVPVDSLITFNLSKDKIEPITEALTIKKYQSQHYTTNTNPKNGGTTCTLGGVSKSQFKRFFKKGLIGSTITFEMDDYVEMEPNNPNCTQWRLFGKSKDIPFNHIIHFNMNDVDKNTLYEFYLDLTWQGDVSQMFYDPKQKIVNIYVNKVTWIVVPSNKVITTEALH